MLNCCWQIKWDNARQARLPMMVSHCRTSSAWLLTLHTSGRLLSSLCLDVGKRATRRRAWRPPALFTCLVPEDWAADSTDPCMLAEGGKTTSLLNPRHHGVSHPQLKIKQAHLCYCERLGICTPRNVSPESAWTRRLHKPKMRNWQK